MVHWNSPLDWSVRMICWNGPPEWSLKTILQNGTLRAVPPRSLEPVPQWSVLAVIVIQSRPEYSQNTLRGELTSHCLSYSIGYGGSFKKGVRNRPITGPIVHNCWRCFNRARM